MTRVTIQSLGQRGEGVAEIDGAKVYVPFALPGEDVEIDVTGDRGVIREMLLADAGTRRADLPAFHHLRRLPAPASAARRSTPSSSARS